MRMPPAWLHASNTPLVGVLFAVEELAQQAIAQAGMHFWSQEDQTIPPTLSSRMRGIAKPLMPTETCPIFPTDVKRKLKII